jgi:hypothetical protein
MPLDMKQVLKIGAIAVLGTGLGLGLTWAAVATGFTFERVEFGAWRAQPQAPASLNDPYMRAFVARNGLAPLGAAEGLAFVAMRDSAGRRLRPACNYQISGPVPQARVWTISVLGADGGRSHRQENRRGFTSAELLRDFRGGFSIALAQQARPGNWLPLAAQEDFIILLRLYDTPRALNAATLKAKDLPQVVAEGCR